ERRHQCEGVEWIVRVRRPVHHKVVTQPDRVEALPVSQLRFLEDGVDSALRVQQKSDLYHDDPSPNSGCKRRKSSTVRTKDTSARPASLPLEGWLRVVHPEAVLEPDLDAGEGLVVLEGGPGDGEARSAAGQQKGVDLA